MSKSPQAFRTIREVADWLGVAAHVLRFWESKFSQIKPVKRAGGRRYYRPSDMELVGGIKVLLHDQGMTIRGVQKMIRSDGVAAISALSPPIDDLVSGGDAIEAVAESAHWIEDAAAETTPETTEAAEPATAPEPAREPEPEPEIGADAAGPAAEPAAETDATPLAPAEAAPEPAAVPEPEPIAAAPEPEDEVAPELDFGAPPEPAPAAEPAETAATQPEAASGPEPADALDALAALAEQARDLPADRRAALDPQIAALEALRDRLAAAPPQG